VREPSPVGEVRPDVLQTYVAAARTQVRTLAVALARTRSRTGREVLARLACPGASAAELEAAAVAYPDGSAEERDAFARSLEVRAALEYAYLTAAQNLLPTDYRVARGLLDAVGDLHGPEALERRDAELLLQLALDSRDFATAEHVLATRRLRGTVRHLAAADAVNPWIRPGQDEKTWLARLNAELYDGRLQPVTLAPDGATPFDRLAAGPAEPVHHERRVTVIMSAYNPDEHLLTAVRSVVQQTWQNLELLIVDDASPAPTPGVLEAAERMDPRVRVIRQRVNGGTYRARNTALTQATGDFFTCVDSDDWAHPQRLELGVRPMLADPTLMATRGSGVRATADLELSRVGRGGRIVVSSSLMVRTFPGLNRLGFFDPVRKGADNEYALRLEAAYGGAVVDLPRRHVLTVLLADDDSLSGADFAPGWRHPSRAEYAESQRHVHREIAAARHPAFLDPDGPRLFPAPRRWERYPQDGEPGPVLDLCLVADWRSGLVDEATLRHAAAAADRGDVVGVVHVESLHDLRPDLEPVTPGLRELIAAGRVERVYLDDDREARAVVVADPRPFQYPGEVEVRLRAHRVHARSLAAAESSGHYDRDTADGHLVAMFGRPVDWSADLPGAPPAR